MTKNNYNAGILGYGEVGQAVSKFFKGKAKIKDLKRDDGLEGVEFLHICIPYNNSFTAVVKKEIKRINPKLTIIHSTVFPYTTEKLAKDFKGMVVHSPIRGVHPKLYEGIKTFIKYIGADNKKAGNLAKNHLKALGIKTKVFSPSVTTEIGKLLDTSYYGFCITWHSEAKKICDKAEVDFIKAVNDFDRTYNEGYLKLGKKNVIRPVLYPSKNGIGGHCIISNAKILKKYINSPALDLILKYQPKKK
ncbi:MAG: hypothetical protein PHI53_01525 [Candidatus Pacebacteria bacterium]|nr:hypothetical protein [Candidatus Paceibacterota bacterium]